ncbi:MAG: helix-turn-helix transcriptional regulator [Negativicutes bacterium]|nr:helix-turn-helix transcriptional regulator [Negativicutes bacterium]
MNIGSRLKQVREGNKISGKALAEKVNVVPSQIYKIENGTTNPSIDLLQRICHAVGITMAEFFSDVETYQKVAADPKYQILNEEDIIEKYKSLPETSRKALASIIDSLASKH